MLGNIWSAELKLKDVHVMTTRFASTACRVLFRLRFLLLLMGFMNSCWRTTPEKRNMERAGGTHMQTHKFQPLELVDFSYWV